MNLSIYNHSVFNNSTPTDPPEKVTTKRVLNMTGSLFGVSNLYDKYMEKAPSVIINKAKASGYENLYSMKISDDGLLIKITVKDQERNLKEIKADFLNGRSGIIVKKGDIPYGNVDIIERKFDEIKDRDPESHNDYDLITLEKGETISLPIEAVIIQEKPCGF